MSSRAKLLLLFMACASPFVLGWAAYYFGWGQGAPGNYGELITPRALSAPAIRELSGKWILVSFDAGKCDPHCEKKLYTMRQLRRAQGKEMERIERLWVLTDAAPPRAEVMAAMEGTRLARADAALLADFPGVQIEHIYLIDPLGNLMLRFPPDPDPSRMIKDLQRLLRYSRVG